MVYKYACNAAAAAAAKSLQSCLTLCNPMGYTIHGILQARILEPFPSPGDLPHPGIKPSCPALQASSLSSEPPKWLKGPEGFKKIIYFKINYGGDLSSLYAGKP